MAIYKPIKKIGIPIIAIIIGLSTAYLFLPTKMEYEWKRWQSQTKEWENGHYKVEGSFTLNDQVVTTEIGDWSKENSKYTFTVEVSDESKFDFDVYFEGESLFVFSGGEWYQNDVNSRFVQEFTPVHQPFAWVRELLQEADHVERKKDGEITTYLAKFVSFNELDFRGYQLSKQENTFLKVIEKNGHIQSLTFHVIPTRPETLGPLDSYPDQLSYTMTFSETDSVQFDLPDKAYEGKKLD